jgi:hypothetical protein
VSQVGLELLGSVTGSHTKSAAACESAIVVVPWTVTIEFASEVAEAQSGDTVRTRATDIPCSNGIGAGTGLGADGSASAVGADADRINVDA